MFEEINAKRIEDYLELVNNKLENKEIYIELVDSMPREYEEQIISILYNKYPNLGYKKVGILMPQLIIFKNKLYSKKDYNASYVRFNTAFYSKNYQKCIDELDIVIHRLKDKYFPALVYKRISLIFSLIGKQEESKKYDKISLLLFENYILNHNFEDIYYEYLSLVNRLNKERIAYVIPKTISDSLLKKLAYILDFKIITIPQDEDNIIIERKSNAVKNYNLYQMRSNINTAFYNHDYTLCINYLEDYLAHSSFDDSIKAKCYYRLGICYKNLGDYEQADEMLKISSFIKNIKNEDIKSSSNDEIAMEDFDTLMIVNAELEGIASNILGTNVSISEIAQEYNLTEEQVMIIKLLIARDCFVNENYTLGNKYLKEVEKIKEKTPLIKIMFNEVLSNRMFYKNRKSSVKVLKYN